MTKDEVIKEQIKMCLSCRKGHEILKKYKDIYPIVNNKEISPKNNELVKSIKQMLDCNNFDEACQNIYAELKKKFRGKGEILLLVDNTKAQLQYGRNQNIERRLGKYILNENEILLIEEMAQLLNIKGDIEEKWNMIKALSESRAFEVSEETVCINNMRVIINLIQYLYADKCSNLFTANGKHKKIIQDILDIMNEQNKKKIGKDYTGYDKNKETIEHFVKIGALDSNMRIKHDKRIQEIFEKFCSVDSRKYEIETGRNCESEMFLRYVENIDEDYVNKKNNFLKRFYQLPEDKREIAYLYLKNAPKKTYICIRETMRKQNMGEKQIERISKFSHSTVQDMQKPPYKKVENIIEISKVLLVSPEVLFTGTGKIYGNWNDCLNKDFLQELQKLDEGKEFKCVGDIEKKLKELLEMEYSEFLELLKNYPEFFCEEEYELFDNELEYFEALLNEKEFYTLLEVLENH